MKLIFIWKELAVKIPSQ